MLLFLVILKVFTKTSSLKNNGLSLLLGAKLACITCKLKCELSNLQYETNFTIFFLKHFKFRS